MSGMTLMLLWKPLVVHWRTESDMLLDATWVQLATQFLRARRSQRLPDPATSNERGHSERPNGQQARQVCLE